MHRLNLEGSPRSWGAGDWKTEGEALPFPAHPLTSVSRQYIITCLIIEGIKGHNSVVPQTWSPPLGMTITASPHTARQESLAFPRRWGRNARLNKAGRRTTKGDAGLSLLCVPLPRVLTSHQKAGVCSAGSDGGDGLWCPFSPEFPNCQPKTLSSSGTNGVPWTGSWSQPRNLTHPCYQYYRVPATQSASSLRPGLNSE